MHAEVEWHSFKWKDTLAGQKSSKCKQASVKEIKATLKVESLVKPGTQWNNTSFKKKEKRKEIEKR